MMRAALIAVGLGALVLMELRTPPRTAGNVPEPLAPSLVGLIPSRDTLMQADRFQISHALVEAPGKPISPVEPTPPPPVTTVIPQRASVAIEPSRHRANDKKADVVKPKSRPRHADSKKAAKTDPSRATIEVKPCRPTAFDSLLKVFSLAPGCET
jgi:hypothetical protein